MEKETEFELEFSLKNFVSFSSMANFSCMHRFSAIITDCFLMLIIFLLLTFNKYCFHHVQKHQQQLLSSPVFFFLFLIILESLQSVFWANKINFQGWHSIPVRGWRPARKCFLSNGRIEESTQWNEKKWINRMFPVPLFNL